MKIEEIAQKLKDCAILKCDRCEYLHLHNLSRCQGELIKKMANECRKIVEEMEDDGK